MPINHHRSRHKKATARSAKWWQCFVTSLQISDSSDSETEFFVENTTATEYEHDPQPWPPPRAPPPPPPDNILRPPPPPPFPLESPPFSPPPSLRPNHARNENSSPPFRTPAPPVPLSPPPPPPLPRFGRRSMPMPIIYVGEDSSTSSPSRFPPRRSLWEYFFPEVPSPPAEQRLDEDTTVYSAVLNVKISEACKRDDPHCPICREEYKVGEEAAKLRCFHAFHSECVLSWLDNHKTCPVCRREVEAPPRDEWETNILDVGVTIEVPQPPITLQEEEIEENNNDTVNWDIEAEIGDIEETHEVGDSNSTSDSDEAGYDSARDELDESHG